MEGVSLPYPVVEPDVSTITLVDKSCGRILDVGRAEAGVRGGIGRVVATEKGIVVVDDKTHRRLAVRWSQLTMESIVLREVGVPSNLIIDVPGYGPVELVIDHRFAANLSHVLSKMLGEKIRSDVRSFQPSSARIDVPPPPLIAALTKPSEGLPPITILGSGAGLALAGLGSILPWATLSTVFGSISMSGTEGDGLITLVVSLIGLALVGLASVSRPNAIIGAVVAAGLVLIVGVYDLANIADIESEEAAVVQVGVGLWLLVVGALVAIVGGVFGFVSRR